MRPCLSLLKSKRPVPLGYSRKDFFKKVHSPGASKPWRSRSVLSKGQIEVSASVDVMLPDGQLDHGRLAQAAPLGLTSSQHFADGTCGAGGAGELPLRATGMSVGSRGDASRAEPSLCSSDEHLSSHPPAAHAASGREATRMLNECLQRGEWAADSGCSSADGGVAGKDGFEPSAELMLHQTAETAIANPSTLPFGKALDLTVEKVSSYEGGPIPLHLQQFKRTRREAAESIALPRHINQLFHKIMGWTEELAELEVDKAEADTSARPGAAPQGELTQLRRKYDDLSGKMKYGVLLAEYEKDKFAIEHRLQLAGDKMERKFLDWEGMHMLDQNPAAEMEAVQENKSSLIIERAPSFHIPVVNRDCCPGCGALLQDKDENSFGFVRKGEVEKHIIQRQQTLRARSEYADRMAELQRHWEKNGRHVGEEWLDFMTQEEFNAIYRDRNLPFVCHRCHALENLGVEGRRKVWSAPDFSENLRALKERKCVVVLVVDVTDFPGSMVYDLPGLISMNNDVIIAVNKMDCVRNRSFAYRGTDKGIATRLVPEAHVRKWVKEIAVQFGLPRHQIRDVIPLSAKRGWNVDKLIAAIEDASNLNLARPQKPLRTYVVGVANTGKSSLINAIAHKLYVRLPPHPEAKKVYFTRTDKSGKESVFWRWHTPPNVNRAEMIDIPSRHDKKASKLMTVSSLPGTTVAANAVRISLARSKSGEYEYLFDTPGLLPHWHQQSPLTLLQMRRTLIRKYRNPQCFILQPGNTLLMGGLAAIDVVRGSSRGLLFMLYTSQKVRSAIVITEASDTFWQEQLGKALDPPGSLEQLGELTLSESRSYLFECYSRHLKRPKADLYVCGLGWASFCVAEPCDVVLRVRTLPGVVHGVREPLRNRDLLSFGGWPKLKRRFTAAALSPEDAQDSINAVVRLTARATRQQNQEPRVGDGTAPQAADPLPRVPKAVQTHHEVASAEPFDQILEELETRGVVG